MSELVRVLGQQDVPAPLLGRINLRLDYETDAAGELTGGGNLEISRRGLTRSTLLTPRRHRQPHS